MEKRKFINYDDQMTYIYHLPEDVIPIFNKWICNPLNSNQDICDKFKDYLVNSYNHTIQYNSPPNWEFTPGEGWKYVGPTRDENEIKEIENPHDSVVMSVINEHVKRARKGKEKYGVNLDRTDLSIIEWLQHAKEEALDLALYLEKLIQTLGGKKDVS